MDSTIKDISSHASYALGHITESLEDLIGQYNGDIPADINNFHPNRKAEYVVTRILLSQLCAHIDIEYKGVSKDDCGKPHLIDQEIHISVTHAYPYVSCLIDKLQPCGIDMENPREQLRKIKHKFLNSEEQQQVGDNIHKLCQYWCAKEALYKIHGRKKLVFNRNLNVREDSGGTFIGEIIVDGYTELYNLRSEFIEGHYLVYNI